MSRAGGNSLLDTTTLTRNPRKVVAWFLLGSSIAAVVNVMKMRTIGYDKYSYQLHRRVSENEQTHAILRMLNFHLSTRKLGVFDANP
jgi:hypothetical protein